MAALANPLLARKWDTSFEICPFDAIQHGHFEEAFEEAFRQSLDDLALIVQNTQTPTFENTVKRFDAASELLARTSMVFFNLCSSHCPPELQEVQRRMSGPLALHRQKIYMFPGLFSRVETVYQSRSGLEDEQIRLTERIHLDFTRAGARFGADEQSRYTAVVEKLARLTTQFSQNVMKDESEVYLEIGVEGLTDLPAFLIDSMRQAAADKGLPNSYVLNLSRSLVVPFLTFSPRRDLREKIFNLWSKRGELEMENRDNLAIAREILQLRKQQATLHGLKNFADFQLLDTMAGTPEKVEELLSNVWNRGKDSAQREREELMKVAANEDLTEIQPYDWRYYAEKVRSEKFNLDESVIKPYFSLDRMVDAIFYCAKQLFGLTFLLREDIKTYHPDVRVYEVHDEGRVIALFLHDNYSRSGFKQSGAWMSSFRVQHRNTENGKSVIPIVINNNNFAKSTPCLLSFDDARTLFHEFGHGLHGMLSDVTYNRLSGTSVLRDFVELPSQLYEHWLSQPEILKKFALHHETNEPISDELLSKLFASKKFNLGFETIEYTACAMIDQSLHKFENVESLDIATFESEELKKYDMPPGIVLRHRPAHFSHLFSGSSYAAAYYVYLWAEVLDADGFDAFLQAGNIFDKTVASRARKYIYSSGNSIDPSEAYRLFRGRDPSVTPMLMKKGLV